MKKQIRTRALILTLSLSLLSASSASATQYSIFLAQPANQVANETQYQTILEKTILIDTDQHRVRLPLPPYCSADGLCTEALRWSEFELKESRYLNGDLLFLTAISGKQTLKIDLGPNHSTRVTLINQNTSDEAVFIGGPAEVTHFAD